MNLMEFVVKPEEIETKNFPFTEYELEKIKLAKLWGLKLNIVVDVGNGDHYKLRAMEILA